jgi:hypothetical protein
MECLLLWGVDVVIYPVTTSYIVNLSRNKWHRINKHGCDFKSVPKKKLFPSKK